VNAQKIIWNQAITRTIVVNAAMQHIHLIKKLVYNCHKCS